MNKKKNILFLHQNFPGQYKFLAPALAKEKDIEVFSISQNESSGFSDIKHTQYFITNENVPNLNRLSIEFETKMIRALAVSEKCFEMKDNGFNPDLIISHPGWGEGFLLKDIWPNTKFLNYLEFYYNTKDSDIDFDIKENEKITNFGFELTSKLTARNAPHLSSYVQADQLITPTNFQKSTAPKEFLQKIKVIHDGIDTNFVKPKDDPYVILKNDNNEEVKLTKDDKIVTFVNRNLEPYRGYHIFMRALPKIIEKHPDAYILIVGGSSVSYGATPKNGNYKELYFGEIKDKIPEDNRVRFLGQVPYDILLNLFNVTDAHIYYTYPFVLSWSMLEAMSMEALVIGSKTLPVEEVIKHNENGLLLDFFDHNLLSETVNNVLSNPDKYISLKKNARNTIVDEFDLLSICLPKQIELVRSLLE